MEGQNEAQLLKWQPGVTLTNKLTLDSTCQMDALIVKSKLKCMHEQ